MISELAMGVENPYDVVLRYGYEVQDYLKMLSYPWFTRMVSDKRDRMVAEGFTFRVKMGAMAEDLLIDAYRAARKVDSVALKLDVAKYLTKVADLEPRVAAQASEAGAGFSITITLSQPSTTQSNIIELTANAASTEIPGERPALEIDMQNYELGLVDEVETAA